MLAYLLKDFGPIDITRTPSREEQKVIKSFTRILREAMYDDLVVEEEEDNCIQDDESDPTWVPEDEEPSFDQTSTSVAFLFNEVEVPKEKVCASILLSCALHGAKLYMF